MSERRALAGGVVCAGFDGREVDAALERRLRALPLAGLILFGRNIDSLAQTRALTDRLRELYERPIIAIDQEGGRVARLREGVEEFPSMMALAASGDPSLAQRAGAQLAFDLRRAGVNVDFAPVLDLALQPMNTVIGARSFGADPHRVGAFAQAFATGMHSAGIIATFKHFPGHGSTEVDSHLDLPVIDDDEATLRSRDFVPFARLLPNAKAVMTAHIVVRALDRDRPATASPVLLTDVLRSQMRFRGVCFTDCLQMDAIAKGIGSAQAAVAALNAGADCLLFSHDLNLVAESIDRIVAAVGNGEVARSRLQQAFERVSALRETLQPPLAIDAPGGDAGIAREIGRRAVTLVRGSANADPDESIVVSFEGTTLEGAQGRHAAHASLFAPSPIAALVLPLEPMRSDVEAAMERIENSRKRPIVLMRRAHVYAGQLAAVQRIIERYPDALVVSTREPFDALRLPQAQHLLCTYGDEAASLAGLSDALFGGAAPAGRLPV